MKKILSLVLALSMVLCLFALQATAEELPLSGKFIILHTNDIHGHGMDDADTFGYCRVAALKQSLIDRGAEVILVDAGDFSQGTPLVNLSYGAAAIEFMNVAGYDIAVPGNHEFDWGADTFLTNAQYADFSILCANLTNAADGELLLDANKIVELSSGIKVGFFGLDTPEVMTKTHPDKIKNIDISMTDELYAVAQAQVDQLKEAGCSLIVCVGHLGQDDESAGNRSTDVIEKVSGIDLFIDGHSHTVIDGGEMDGETLRVSTGTAFEYIGYVEVSFDGEGEEMTKSLNAGLYSVQDDAEASLILGCALSGNQEVHSQVSMINDIVQTELSAVFAKTEVLLNGERNPGVRTQETNLGDFATDAILWSARQALGEDKVDAAVTNGGGIRATIDIGDISMLDMKTVFPFGNEVATVTVTGAELLEALEAATFETPGELGAFPQVSGIVFEIDTSVPFEAGALYPDSTYYQPAKPGSRVTITEINGQPFDPEKMYTIATNDFTAAGGDTYYVFRYPFQQTGYKTGVALEDALVNYVAEVLDGVVGETYAEPMGRIIIK